MSKRQLSLSVIVPARNAEATLGRVLPVWKRPGHGDCELIAAAGSGLSRPRSQGFPFLPPQAK